ncbi:MAG: ABC transporter ATP-binding protein [Oscillospiraceae bacterium]|nr:ABC transporter ATP-binding protein [Oscillospiraceae bacterium]
MIVVDHLTKHYGTFAAVNDLSFEIRDGGVYGFLGPNGAGKSSTMNIMTGCLSPTGGTVRIGGHDILKEPEAAKRLIGYLPEHPPLYTAETPAEYLRFVGEAKGLKGAELRRQIDEVIQLTGIGPVRDRLISVLSKGYCQRVGIAQALLGTPGIIILDEPTVGLDPIQIIEIRDLIRDLGKTHTVLFSSHILSEVQSICEQVLILSKGTLVAFDTPDKLEKLLTQSGGILILTQAAADTVDSILNQVEGLSEWESTACGDGCLSVSIKAETQDLHETARRLFFAFAERQTAILEMTVKRANLEDVFLELTEDTRPLPAEAQDRLPNQTDGVSGCENSEVKTT